MNIGDSDLRFIKKLGSGGFGSVYWCESERENEPRNIVVKRIDVENPDERMKEFMKEVYIFSQLKHPRIVRYLRSYVYRDTVNIVMEYMPQGTLRMAIMSMCSGCDPVTSISCTELRQHFCDILMGLEYLHIRHVIHQDLKPDNLLLDSRGRIKIADFGIAAIHVPNCEYGDAGGTAYYMAPESLFGGTFSFKSDIWSLGCIVYEMCIGRSPFSRARHKEDLMYYMKCSVDFEPINEYFGSLWGGLCEEMLQYNRDQRISLSGIVCYNGHIAIPYHHLYFDYDY